MVIDDLNFQKENIKKNKDKNHYQVGYFDRILANVIDLIILMPVVSLFNAGIISEIKWTVLTFDEPSIFFYLIQYVFVASALFVLYESLFLYFIQASPGHFFLQIRIQPAIQPSNLPSTSKKFYFAQKNTGFLNNRLNYTQCLIRTFFKLQSYFLFFIPFIEILISDDRSAFYDRVARTEMFSLKKASEDHLPNEYKTFITSWMRLSFLGLFLVLMSALVITSKNDYRILNQSSKLQVKSKLKCNQNVDDYFINILSEAKKNESEKCLSEIVENEFDSEVISENITKTNKDILEQKFFNYLYKSYLTDDEKMKEIYLEKFCTHKADSAICSLSSKKMDINTAIKTWMDRIKSSQSEHSNGLDKKKIIYGLILLKQSLDAESYHNSFKLLDLMYEDLTWNDYFQSQYLLSYLLTKENDLKQKRSIANFDNQDVEMIARFKKRMRIVK